MIHVFGLWILRIFFGSINVFFFGCINYSMNCLWKLKLPLKVYCFLWLVVQNKILTTDNLSRKGWVGPLSCVFCQVNESVNHLFLSCPFMSDFLGAFNICNIHQIRMQLTSLNDLWDSALHLSGLDRIFALSVLAMVFWVRWNKHNRVIFSHHSVLSFNAFILKVTNYLHIWIGTNSFLDHMCQEESVLTITAD
jgi:zinc-binding in reverse transcriptase